MLLLYSKFWFLPYDATHERGHATVSRLSIRLSVRDVEVCFSHRLEFFKSNVTALVLFSIHHVSQLTLVMALL